ncbi:protein-export chaperone SecB [Marinobacter koreensis]|uniref:Protein-export protein SecB n=3 Tax=Marinobacter TaxID=2742 RepID=M7CSV9_9GAMM|nr:MULTISPECIES: protein-export chaperone SecB [Marinobacter]EMP55230.1 preprotein translocase subunit SecB [Marinobacter santoriniensis NKSG1]MCK7546494.1 protein-export chaperone SecB [Marinobacter koreensis]MDX1818388.1 protein-export chaperone SecB [Marinobacter sp.]
MAENQQAAGNDNQNQPQFALQRIYVKDLSFESPNSPLVFQEQWQPQVNLDLNTSHEKVSDNQYEVVLSLTVTTKIGDKVAYIVEIQQAGVFLVHGIEGPQLGQMLGAYCPTILFPYARESIDNVVNKGSFPALMLAPVNFDAIYAQALQRKQQEAEGGAEEESKTH